MLTAELGVAPVLGHVGIVGLHCGGECLGRHAHQIGELLVRVGAQQQPRGFDLALGVVATLVLGALLRNGVVPNLEAHVVGLLQQLAPRVGIALALVHEPLALKVHHDSALMVHGALSKGPAVGILDGEHTAVAEVPGLRANRHGHDVSLAKDAGRGVKVLHLIDRRAEVPLCKHVNVAPVTAGREADRLLRLVIDDVAVGVVRLHAQDTPGFGIADNAGGAGVEVDAHAQLGCLVLECGNHLAWAYVMLAGLRVAVGLQKAALVKLDAKVVGQILIEPVTRELAHPADVGVVVVGLEPGAQILVHLVDGVGDAQLLLEGRARNGDAAVAQGGVSAHEALRFKDDRLHVQFVRLAGACQARCAAAHADDVGLEVPRLGHAHLSRLSSEGFGRRTGVDAENTAGGKRGRPGRDKTPAAHGGVGLGGPLHRVLHHDRLSLLCCMACGPCRAGAIPTPGSHRA